MRLKIEAKFRILSPSVKLGMGEMYELILQVQPMIQPPIYFCPGAAERAAG